jgi:conjugal transfer pilus assembly protein TraE
MFSDISHERQQSLLRQRNLFALTSAGLGLALVVAGSLAATRDREVVLVSLSPAMPPLFSSIAARRASITG